MKVLFLLASKNFRDIEYIVPKAFFEQHNVEVNTISSEKVSVGRFGFKVQNNFLLDELSSANDYAGIFLVGGTGSLDYLKNEKAKILTNDFVQKGKIVGAICAAPRLLLDWQILNNKKCTGYNGDEQLPILCEKNNAIFVNEEVVVDKNFITGNGPTASENFANHFLKLINQKS